MKITLAAIVTLALGLLVTAAPRAQSLGDVAAAEATRRGNTEKSKTVWTNADLPAAPDVLPGPSISVSGDDLPSGGAPVTVATFSALYRAGKTVQGATASGVTYVKFGELLQGFSTEMQIAKDHPLNDTDTSLLALYEKAFGQYQFSALLWKRKLDSTED